MTSNLSHHMQYAVFTRKKDYKIVNFKLIRFTLLSSHLVHATYNSS